jgi:hypothetical protein
MALEIAVFKYSRCWASWCAMVVMKKVSWRRPMDADHDAKKKVAPKTLFAAHRSASDPIIAVFSQPAGPVIHLMFLGCSNAPSPSIIQSYKSSWTATRVAGWHFGASQRSAESWMAPAAIKPSSPARSTRYKGEPLLDGQNDEQKLTFQWANASS